MKKIFYLLMVALFGVTVVGCGGNNKTTTTTTTQAATTTKAADTLAPMLTLKTEAVSVMKGIQEFDVKGNISMAFDAGSSEISAEDVVIDDGGYKGKDTEAGTYTVTYTLTDKAGNETVKTCVVTVTGAESSIVWNNKAWKINYNPVVGAQYTQKELTHETWAYELDKVTVMSKDYFKYAYDAVYERISCRWSTVMVTNAEFEITYVRHHSSNEYYEEDGVIVSKVSENWSIGTPVDGGVNGHLVDQTQGAQCHELLEHIPDGGYVLIFINDGMNVGDECPRGFGDLIFNNANQNYGIGEKVMFTADFDAFNADNAPAYIRSAQVEGTDYGVEKTLKYTNESNVPNLLEGLSVMTLDAATGLAKVDTSVEIEVTIYKVVDGEKVEVEEINTQFPANGTAPEVQYVVDYVVTHNGQTDMVSRIYTLAE
jgi:hypothetical protein